MNFNTLQISIIVLLISIIFGSYATSDEARQVPKSIRERSVDSNNEYVWFTRDAPDENGKPSYHQRKQHPWFHMKQDRKPFNPVYSLGKNSLYEKK